jgi:uncharacterized membrane protein
MRARRGAIVALVAVLLVAMVGLFALAADFGRLDNLKADLQTSAEAAALAGAVELIDVPPHNPTTAVAVAIAWVAKNPAMQATVSVDSAKCGTWYDTGPLFLDAVGGCSGASNAVKITVSRQSSGLFMSALGVSAPILKATATAAVRPDSAPTYDCRPTNDCRVFLVTTPP